MLVWSRFPRFPVPFSPFSHSDIRLTMNTYAHLFPAMGEKAAGKMDAILAPAGPKVAEQAQESVN